MATISRHFKREPMKASIVDLRYKTKEILQALERNEEISILYHEKVKGIISPVKKKSSLKITDHPYFGMNSDSKQSVVEEANKLRNLRY